MKTKTPRRRPKVKKTPAQNWRSKCEIIARPGPGWSVVWKLAEELASTPYSVFYLSSDNRVVGWICGDRLVDLLTVFRTREYAEETLANAAPPPGAV